jgi:hypothetical protein
MPLLQSREVAAGAPVPSVYDANEPYAITGNYTIKTGDASGDIIEMGGVPSMATVIDFVVHHDGIGGTVDAGILSGDYAKKDNARTCGQEFGAALATASAGVLRLAKNTNALVPTASEQGWGIKLLAAPTVGKVIRATLIVIPQGF